MVQGKAVRPIAPRREDRVSASARTLWLDVTAARVIALLEQAGLPVVLLKGRAVAAWLYADEVRDYTDIDLLVNPAQLGEALRVLGSIGFQHRLQGASRSEYGRFELELFDRTGTCIDLHHSLIGVSAGPAACWSALSSHTEALIVGGRPVAVLDVPARTMHLALHAAQNGAADSKAVADLDRGLTQVPLAVWREALALAMDLDAVQAFSGGLQLTRRGRETAVALCLGPPSDVAVLLRIASLPQEALQIQHLWEQESVAARTRLVARKLWPTSAYMRCETPTGVGGPAPLLTARLRRAARLPRRSVRAVRHWLLARRVVARGDVQPLLTVRREHS